MFAASYHTAFFHASIQNGSRGHVPRVLAGDPVLRTGREIFLNYRFIDPRLRRGEIRKNNGPERPCGIRAKKARFGAAKRPKNPDFVGFLAFFILHKQWHSSGLQSSLTVSKALRMAIFLPCCGSCDSVDVPERFDFGRHAR